MDTNKVLLGLSGGVDSSLCAALLREQGYEVTGLFLSYNGADAEPARLAARQAGIPLEVTDMTNALEREVIAPFIAAYLRGETPNPCVMCNPAVKFLLLAELADKIGAQHIATGHYAKIKTEAGGHKGLYRSDSPKDQSYMLYRLGQNIIDRCIFPLCDIESKDRVREMARQRGLAASGSPDSMEVCFIPCGDHGAFMEGRGFSSPPGDFVDERGAVLGRHEGIHRYTVGQRRGLGIAAEGRLYVKSILPEGNKVVLGLEPPAASEIVLNDTVCTAYEYSGMESVPVLARIRHSRGMDAATLFPKEGRIVFASPARAPSRGQSAVCYNRDGRVIFGGYIG